MSITVSQKNFILLTLKEMHSLIRVSTLLREHTHDDGSADGLDVLHRIPCLLLLRGSKGHGPLPAVRLYAQRIDET